MIADLDFSAPLAPLAAMSPAHFVGIGGAGMSAVARLWLAAGVDVSGSDAKDSVVLTGLRSAGARVALGHDAQQLGAARTLVVSSAVREDNPEVVAARAAGLRILHRSQALAAVGWGRSVIAVAGTNGKTTTTAMITTILRAMGREVGFCLGGGLLGESAAAGPGAGSASLGRDPLLVVEADESDGSFVVYRPQLAVITNIQADHLDHYGDFAGVQAGFAAFAASIQPGGCLILGIDDPGAAQLGQQLTRAEDLRILSFGGAPEADLQLAEYHPHPGGADFKVRYQGQLAAGHLRVPGRHNLLNIGATICVGLALDLPLAELVAAAPAFEGTRRRFEARGLIGGARVFDDYAHNPAKVAAALATARQVAGEGRLLVAFQPHLFSRTRDFAREFGQALGQADEVFILDVFPAREEPLPGVSGALVAAEVSQSPAHVHYLPERAGAASAIAAQLQAGDVLVTIGAGDVTELAQELRELSG